MGFFNKLVQYGNNRLRTILVSFVRFELKHTVRYWSCKK
jgi:hypothetical protein